jgi:hypothetical protein
MSIETPESTDTIPARQSTLPVTAATYDLIPLVAFGTGFMCSLAFAAVVLPSLVLRQSKRYLDANWVPLGAGPQAGYIPLPAAGSRHSQSAGVAGTCDPTLNSAWQGPSPPAETWSENATALSADLPQEDHDSECDQSIIRCVFEQNLELRNHSPESPDDSADFEPTIKFPDDPAAARSRSR